MPPLPLRIGAILFGVALLFYSGRIVADNPAPSGTLTRVEIWNARFNYVYDTLGFDDDAIRARPGVSHVIITERGRLDGIAARLELPHDLGEFSRDVRLSALCFRDDGRVETVNLDYGGNMTLNGLAIVPDSPLIRAFAHELSAEERNDLEAALQRRTNRMKSAR
jgi:hypothetical protein